MVQNKYMVGAGVGLAVLVVLGGGIVLWHGEHHRSLVSLGAASADISGAAGSNSIPLTPTGPAPADAGGLSVSSSNASSSIGQLDGSQKKTGSQSGSGSGSSSSSASPIDPSTFSQYEKYKDSQGALFGEVQAGTGTELTTGHKAAVYYRGWLTNGTLFDQSRAGSDGKLQPFIFTLGDHQVIPGWEQALAGMKVGAVRLVIVPPAVGYGATGQGSIPPNAVLVFQVQLAEVQ